MDEKTQEQLKALIALASVHDDQTVRANAIMKLAGHYLELYANLRDSRGWLDDSKVNLMGEMSDLLLKVIETPDLLSEEVKQEIGLKLVQIAQLDDYRKGELLLRQLVKNDQIPKPVKTAAELRFVSLVSDYRPCSTANHIMVARYGYATLIEIAEGEQYSEQARAAARETMPVLFKKTAEECAIGSLRKPTQDDEWDDYAAYEKFEEKLFRMLKDPRVSEELRMEAGKSTIEVYKYYPEALEKMLRNTTLPEKLREDAGVALVALYVEQGDPKKLSAVAEMQRIPPLVQNAVKEGLGRAEVTRLEIEIDNHATLGEYKQIDGIMANDTLPEGVRKYAKERRSKAIRKRIDRATRPTDFFLTGDSGGRPKELIAISKDETVPEDLRTLARANIMEAVDTAILRAGGYGNKEDILIRLARNEELPVKARKKALDAALKSYADGLGHGLIAYRTYLWYSQLLNLATDNELRQLDGEGIDRAVEKAARTTIERLLEDKNGTDLKKMSGDEKLPESVRAMASVNLRQLLSGIEKQMGMDGELMDAPKLTKRPVPEQKPWVERIRYEVIPKKKG